MTAFDCRLKNAIKCDFIHSVIPRTFLFVVHSVDVNVLTQSDVTSIEAIINQKGSILGASALLEYLYHYENWFECLIKVLQHEHVKQGHLISGFLKKFDEVKADMNGERAAPMVAQKTYDSERQQPMASGACDPLSTMELLVDGLQAENMDEEEESHPISPSQVTTRLINEDSTLHRGAEEPNSGRTQCDEFHQEAVPLSPRESESGQTRQQRAKSVDHGIEYDFTLDEIAPSLHSFPGWHAHCSESQVKQTVLKHLKEDGHFLIFFWKRKKRPGITVSYQGYIKNFIIHKKPPKTEACHLLYFINRKGPYYPNLKDLINHHIQNGILDVLKPQERNYIPLKHAISSLI